MRWLAFVLVLAACQQHDDHDHGDHGHADEQGHDDDHGIVCTRWTEDYELFAELDRPTPGERVKYIAHVTQLDGFKAVTKGELIIEWRDGEQVVASADADQVARKGIFMPAGDAPPKGKHQLVFRFTADEGSATFDCGEIAVG